MTAKPDGPAQASVDPRHLADLSVLYQAQTAAQQAWLASRAAAPPAAMAAWETYFARARELLDTAVWFEQRWPPFLLLSDLALPFVQGLQEQADHAAAAADHARARAYRQQAQEIENRYLGPVAAAQVRRSRAMDEAMQGRFREALTELADVRAVFDAAGERLEAALTVQHIANIYEWLGDYDRALDTLESVRRDTADRMSTAPTTMAGVQDAILREIAAIAAGASDDGTGLDALKLRRIAGELVQAEGRIRRQLRQWKAARSLLRQARPYAEEVGVACAVDYHLGVVATAVGDLDEAEATLTRIEPDFVGLVRPRLAALRLAQADVDLARGRSARALEIARNGLADLDIYPDDDTAWRLQLRVGRALVALERRREALSAYLQGADVVDTLRRGSLGYRLDSTYVADKLPLFIEAIDLACSLDDGDAAAHLIEQAKARALSATLSIPAPDRGEQSPDEQRFDEVCALLDGLEFAASASGGVNGIATRRERRRLSAERDELLERLRIADPRWRGLSQPAAIDVRATLTRLSEGSRAALTLFRHDEAVVAVLLHAGRTRVAAKRLDTETIAALDDYVANLRSPKPFPPLFDPSVATDLALERLVPADLAEEAARATILLVVPHGALHVLPWAGLTLGRHRLFERTTVGILPSLSCVDLLDDVHTPVPDAAVIGDPDYTGLRYESLPEAAAEVDDVARLYGPDLLAPAVTGAAADERAFWALAHLPGAASAVLHVACHATLDATSPLQSGLLLTRSKVDAAEIALARLPWPEVVLSACSTGWRPERVGPLDLAGDDALGLTASFLEAGAQFVLVSIPPAYDAAARAFAVIWHRHRRAGRSPLAAATAARQDLMADGVHEPWSWIGIQTYGCR
jgi:CHAT domain-containing protein/tetratricopeptide (TPR) repeat protein